MKIIDLYESDFLTDKDKILKWIGKSFEEVDSNKLTIESDGLVYDGDLILKLGIDELKVKFKSVNGLFICVNTQISSLEGSPKMVGSSFICNNTNITSLKFCPTSVGKRFYCGDIKITDPTEYRFVLYSEISDKFESGIDEIDDIINTYAGSVNRKHWPHAINLLSKVKL